MATPKQLSFIDSLLRDRVVPEAVTATTTTLLERPDFTVGQASKLIDSLMALPKKPAAAKPAYAVPTHLEGLAKCKYAFWWEQLHTAGVDGLAGHNSKAFFRVNHWKGRVFLDQLHGAPGSFSKSRLTPAEEVAVAGLIRLDAQAGALLFAVTYQQCARCGAELTEDLSISRGLGPTCAGYLGY